MAQLSKVLKVVCCAGSVPFPPVSLQRQVVCLTEYGLVHRGDCINCETCYFCLIWLLYGRVLGAQTFTLLSL